jgi:hypothetical protein
MALGVLAVAALLSYATGVGPARDNIACAFDTKREEKIVSRTVEDFRHAVSNDDFAKACDLADLPGDDDLCKTVIGEVDPPSVLGHAERVRLDGDKARVRLSGGATIELEKSAGLLSTSYCDWKVTNY